MHVEGLPIIGVLLVLIAVFMIAAPQVFLGYRIYMSFLATVPPQLILALGLTLVIASGEIDLSFPSVIAFSGFLFAWAFKTYELTWLALLLALAGGALVGWVNGILVAVIGIPSIIATLATQFFWGGITTVMTGGLSYAIRTIDDYAIHDVLVGRIGVVPVQALWATAVAVALWFVLNRHRFGEHLLFIGDNVEVARVVGVNVGREKIKLFTLMGVLGAFAAVLLDRREQELLQHPGLRLSAHRDGRGVHRRHLDLRRQGDDRRLLRRRVHHRHDRGRPGRDRHAGLLGARGGRPRVPRRGRVPSEHGPAAAPFPAPAAVPLRRQARAPAGATGPGLTVATRPERSGTEHHATRAKIAGRVSLVSRIVAKGNSQTVVPT